MSNVDRLYSQVHNTERNIRNCKNKKAVLQRKIQRLYGAKKEVANIKNDVCTQKNRINYKFKNLDNWEGSNYNKYQMQVDSGLIEGQQQYFYGVDNILDAINDEITRLQNESYELDSSIGWFRSRINSLLNEIENFIN